MRVFVFVYVFLPHIRIRTSGMGYTCKGFFFMLSECDQFERHQFERHQFERHQFERHLFERHQFERQV